jgi:glycosyltransferase involved in cell wall biosynthesis
MPVPTKEAGLIAHLESELPDRIPIGRGTSVLVHGWVFHTESRVRGVRLRVGEHWVKARGHSAPRSDVFAQTDRDIDPQGNSYWSGFWSVIDLQRRRVPGSPTLMLEAKLADGRVVEHPLTELELTPAAARDYDSQGWIKRVDPRDRSMFICMPTYNPDPALLEIQLDSIRAQSYEDWSCLVFDDGSDDGHFAAIEDALGDDPRFALYRGERRRGFYRNVEWMLQHVPYAAELVALADQDDRWHPDKLNRLTAALGGTDPLAYCNSRVMSLENGTLAVKHASYWEAAGRANEYRRLGSLILANSVTGAASVFRRHLLSYALPFPATPGIDLHDQWLAVVAKSLGGIAFVDEILHDQVLHGANVTSNLALPWRDKAVDGGGGARARAGSALARGRVLYAKETLRPVIYGRILEIRTGDLPRRRERRAIRRARELDGLRGTAWLMRRWLIPRPLRSETLGVESLAIRGAAWRWAVKTLARSGLKPGRGGRGGALTKADNA